MMKNLLILLLCVFCLGITSCSSDDDPIELEPKGVVIIHEINTGVNTAFDLYEESISITKVYVGLDSYHQVNIKLDNGFKFLFNVYDPLVGEHVIAPEDAAFTKEGISNSVLFETGEGMVIIKPLNSITIKGYFEQEDLSILVQYIGNWSSK